MDKLLITGRQLASARTLAGLSQSVVAERSKVSVPTLKRMEASDGPSSGLPNNVLAVIAALEAAGIQFLDTGDTAGGPGVALKG